MSLLKTKYLLRIEEELKERLSVSADANHRSLNNEITFRLEQSFNTKNPGGATNTPGVDRSDRTEPTDDKSTPT